MQPAATQVASHSIHISDSPTSQHRGEARSSDDILTNEHSNGSIDEHMHREDNQV